MLYRVKILIPATIFALLDGGRKFTDTLLIFFKHTKTSTNNLTGVVVSSSLDGCGNKVLKIRTKCY